MVNNVYTTPKTLSDEIYSALQGFVWDNTESSYKQFGWEQRFYLLWFTKYIILLCITCNQLSVERTEWKDSKCMNVLFRPISYIRLKLLGASLLEKYLKYDM